MPPTVSPVLATRRDSVEQFRGRANSSNGAEGQGLDIVFESLKFENAEYKKLLRELDDRCTLPSLSPLPLLLLPNSGQRSAQLIPVVLIR